MVINELSWNNRSQKNNTGKKGKKNSTEVTHIQQQNESEGFVVDEIVKMERRIFPKHESMASSFFQELSKRNCGLLYAICPPGESIQPYANNNTVAGYVMYSWPSCLLGSINKLAVRESCRRQGYGEALLKTAIEKCKTRNIQRLSLHVDPLRMDAVSLYKKLGFRIDSLIHSYYSQDRHAYRMFLDFY